MARDYLPRADGEFLAWNQGLLERLRAWNQGGGGSALKLGAVEEQLQRFGEALAAHQEAQVAAKAAVMAKDRSRQECEQAIRGMVRQLQNDRQMTDALRRRLGLRIVSGTRTRAAVPGTRPLVLVVPGRTGEREHLLRVIDAANQTRRSWPKGVHGCLLQMAILPLGAPAPKAGEMDLMGEYPRSPITLGHKRSDIGKSAWYRVCWTGRYGGNGPWSLPVRAMIIG